MRRVLIVFVSLATLLALSGTAAAKGKPPKPEPPRPDYTGYTCLEYENMGLFQADPVVAAASRDFSVSLLPDQVACVDVTSDGGAWSFDFSVNDRADGDWKWVSGVNMHVKDSVPGEKCWEVGWSTKPKNPIPDSWSWISPFTEAADDSNVCGERYEDSAPSLVLMAAYSGAEGSRLFIDVRLP